MGEDGVQQETAHLSGFPHFSFHPSISPPSSSLPLSTLFKKLFKRYFLGYTSIPNESSHTGGLTDDKNKGMKKKELRHAWAIEGAWAFSLLWIIMGWATAGRPSTGPGMLCSRVAKPLLKGNLSNPCVK